MGLHEVKQGKETKTDTELEASYAAKLTLKMGSIFCMVLDYVYSESLSFSYLSDSVLYLE